jgi:hypothetical protein
MLKRALVALTTLIALNGAAAAAEKCYDDVNVPAAWTCSGSSSRSADFTNGCKFVAAHTEKVEKECPKPTARWVSVLSPHNALSTDVSQSTVCAWKGLRPSNINGAICASGANTPIVGEGYQSIRYFWGTSGAAMPVGGTSTSVTTIRSSGSSHGSGANSTRRIRSCIGAGTTSTGNGEPVYGGGENDNVRTVVAYACE